MGVQEILKHCITSSGLIEIKLPQTKSHIIQRNNNTIYCCVYEGLEGLFRKDIEETKEFGRKICDKVKEEMKNNGFFTSDELPNYGISDEELKIIFERVDAQEHDLAVIFVYDKEESQRTKDLLDKLLRQTSKY